MVRQPPHRSHSIETPVAHAPSIDDRFAQLSAQFDVLKAQVRQAQQLSSLGTAAAMIAHEVNNLLTPILSYSDYALQDRKSTRLNSSHIQKSRMPSSA